MGKRLNLDILTQRLHIINSNIKINDDYYRNNATKMNVECKICNCKWCATPKDLLRGHGCPSCANKKVHEGQKNTIDGVKMKLRKINPNIEILEDAYENNSKKLKCICKIDGHIFYSTWRDLQYGHGCMICRNKNISISKSGENHHNWKGGITTLSDFLRKNINKWKLESIKKNNYECDITGERIECIHHLYSFNKIVKETITTLCIDIRPNISTYSESELEIIKNKFLEIHNNYGLGVCLCKKEHTLFHSIYGQYDNSPEQYYEFKENRLKQIA